VGGCLIFFSILINCAVKKPDASDYQCNMYRL